MRIATTSATTKARKFLFKGVLESLQRKLSRARANRLALAASLFYLTLQLDCQLANHGLVYRLDPAQRFVENSSLLFRPIGTAGNAAKLAVVKRDARRSHAFHRVLLHGQHHRRN